MGDVDKEMRLRVARKMAQLTAMYFDVMDELERLLDIKEPPAEDGPEIEDLQNVHDRRRWLARVNPRRKLEQVTDMETAGAACVADDEELEATHASWSGGGGSSDFQEACMNANSITYATEDDDDGE